MARPSASPAFGRTGRALLRANGFGPLQLSPPMPTSWWSTFMTMPVILAPNDYARWLSEEPDPRDLMRPFPADLMRMWPISTRVNKPENDDPSIVEPIQLSTDAA